MAIANRKPDSPPPKPPALVESEKPTFLGIVNDNADTNINLLLAYVEGMPWTVTYYSQLVGKHNDIRELDSGQNAAYQQYQRIAELELRVDSALQTSYDAEKALTSVTGSAYVTNFIPNVNDYFVAEAGDRDSGLYRVTGVDRRVFNRDSVYLINYTLVKYVTDQDSDYQNLEAKTIRKYHFSKERLVEGRAPILQENQHFMIAEIGRKFQEMVSLYYRRFFSIKHRTLTVPGQTHDLYDHGVLAFLSAIIPNDAAPEIQKLYHFPVDNERFLVDNQIWYAFLQRSEDILKTIPIKALPVSKKAFSTSSWLRIISYWTIPYVMYPVFEKGRTGSESDEAIEKVATHSLDVSLKYDEETRENKCEIKTKVYKLFRNLSTDGTYVLSRWFYTQEGEATVLDILARDYMCSHQIDLELLYALVMQYEKLPALEKFYYGPVLFLLMKDGVRGFYK